MLLNALSLLGICVAAISGALAAGRKKMDFFGVILIACITALGGGTVRDVLFDSYPVSWVSHPEYLLYTSLCAFLTICIARALNSIKPLSKFNSTQQYNGDHRSHHQSLHKAHNDSSKLITQQLSNEIEYRKKSIMTLFLILDALGLSAFVIIGVQKSLALGLSPSIAIISGMLSGICGGMLRDILCNDIPLVLRKELYAVIALAGALLFVTLEHFHIANELNVLISLTSIFLTRIMAIFFHIEIPKFHYRP
jgi:uncharacterized membrane protein YeiH